jgi:hypothetical protein
VLSWLSHDTPQIQNAASNVSKPNIDEILNNKEIEFPNIPARVEEKDFVS